MIEVERDNTKNVAGTALGLGIGALGLEVLRGGLGGILGGNCGCNGGCGDNAVVNRYEMAQQQKISELQSQIALRDSNTFVDQKLLEVYKYVDGKINGINASISQQAVVNAQVTANLSCMQGQIATLMGLTKTIIPIGNVCPEPMAQYNSWTAPTTTT